MTSDQTLIYPGEAVKALGSGKVAGYLVRFTGPDRPDRQGEFFDRSTDYAVKSNHVVDIYYNHGMRMQGDEFEAAFGNRPIGEASVKTLDDGVWADGVLDTSDPVAARLYGEIEAGRIGWSSGSTSRFVRREPVKAGVVRIARWPIIEATLSRRPVDPGARAVAIKALYDDPIADAADAAASLIDSSARLGASLREQRGRFAKALDQRRADGRSVSTPKVEAFKALIEEQGDLLEAMLELYDAMRPGPDPTLVRSALIAELEGHI